GEFYRDWLPAWAKPREVADHLKIPHVDYFGYGEKLAVLEQGTTDPQGMGFAYDKIATLLANDLANAEDVFRLERPTDAPPVPAKRKRPVPKPSPIGDYKYDLYVSFDHTSLVDEWTRSFVATLVEYAGAMLGRDIRLFYDYRELESGAEWRTHLVDALAHSAFLLAIVTPRYVHSRWAIAEWMTFEER